MKTLMTHSISCVASYSGEDIAYTYPLVQKLTCSLAATAGSGGDSVTYYETTAAVNAWYAFTRMRRFRANVSYVVTSFGGRYSLLSPMRGVVASEWKIPPAQAVDIVTCWSANEDTPSETVLLL